MVTCTFIRLSTQSSGPRLPASRKPGGQAMLTGSCLCSAVAYEVDAPLERIVHCHCQTCRKTHGTAFSSVAAVPREKFRWVRGREMLAAIESSPGKFRRFCSNCG